MTTFTRHYVMFSWQNTDKKLQLLLWNSNTVVRIPNSLCHWILLIGFHVALMSLYLSYACLFQSLSSSGLMIKYSAQCSLLHTKDLPGPHRHHKSSVGCHERLAVCIKALFVSCSDFVAVSCSWYTIHISALIYIPEGTTNLSKKQHRKAKAVAAAMDMTGMV